MFVLTMHKLHYCKYGSSGPMVLSKKFSIFSLIPMRVKWDCTWLVGPMCHLAQILLGSLLWIGAIEFKSKTTLKVLYSPLRIYVRENTL